MNETLLFIIASVGLALSPGPDNLFILAQGLTYGRRAALLTAWGMCSGIAIHTLAAAFGLSALLSSSGVVFTIVKLLGAAYLLHLAWKLWRENPDSYHDPNSAKLTPASNSSLYWRGFWMNVLNPKVALFFLAFFPQFIPVNEPHPLSATLRLGGIFFLQAVIIFSLLAMLTGPISSFLKNRPPLRRALNKVTAIGLAAIGIRLAFTRV